jgi:hypothetical protein
MYLVINQNPFFFSHYTIDKMKKGIYLTQVKMLLKR